MNDTALLDETATHLRRLIQINTTNPPGNELVLAQYLEATLTAAGIETHLFEPVVNRAAVIARIRGTGKAAPVLITAHMDVVGVDADAWTVDAFSAEVRDGCIYGRGAIDDKGMLAVNLMTMLRLKREIIDRGETLDRDVIFVATSDEESGGEYGLGWVINQHPELVRAEFALNEGGRIRIVDGRPLYAAVQTTEKVAHVARLTARGTGGHASIPLEDNAVATLARAVAAIDAHREPVHLLPTVHEFFSRLSRVWPEPVVARAMQDITSDDDAIVERGCSALCRMPMYNAVLRTGVSVTVMSAGVRHNVIPTEATAMMSIRTLPDVSIDDVLRRLEAAVDDPDVTLELVSRGLAAPASEHRSEMFSAIAEALCVLDPNIVTVPYMSTGATESAHLRAWGVQTYGLLPFPLEADDETRMHGHDERLPLESLAFGTRLVYDVVRRIAMPVR